MKCVFISAICMIFAFIGCNDAQVDKLNEIGDISKNLLDEGVERAQNSIPSKEDISKMTPEQLDKILSFEYKIVDFKEVPSAQELESTLNSLGEQRWECLALSQGSVPLRVQCKRPSRIFLRYIFQYLIF